MTQPDLTSPATLLRHAPALRHEATPAERKFWQAPRKHQIEGLKFRRQVPMGRYIADFGASAHLEIELDGVSHIDSAPADARRDAWMHSHGIRVLRFTNADALGNVEGMITAIREFVRTPPLPIPLPQGEGEAPLSPSSSRPAHV